MCGHDVSSTGEGGQGRPTRYFWPAFPEIRRGRVGFGQQVNWGELPPWQAKDGEGADRWSVVLTPDFKLQQGGGGEAFV